MSQKISSKLAIQSWCFRGFEEIDAMLERLLACNISNLELCGFHCKPERGQATSTIKRIMDAGVNITAYGVHKFTADETNGRAAFDITRQAGFETISADLANGGLPVAEALCREYGVKLAIHNHGRRHALGSVAALDTLFAATGPEIGLCLDTAWMLDSGEDPLQVAERFKERLYGIHIKDFVFDRDGKPRDVVVGTGNLDLQGLMHYLKSIDYQGFVTLEYEGDMDNPVPALSECVAAIQAFN